MCMEMVSWPMYMIVFTLYSCSTTFLMLQYLCIHSVATEHCNHSIILLCLSCPHWNLKVHMLIWLSSKKERTWISIVQTSVSIMIDIHDETESVALLVQKKLVLLVRMKLHVGSSCSRFLWTMIVMDGMKLKSWSLVAHLNWCYHEFCCDFCVLIWYGVQIADWQGRWWEVEVPSDVVSCPSPLPLSVTARFCAGHFLLSSVFARCRDDNVIVPVLVYLFPCQFG